MDNEAYDDMKEAMSKYDIDYQLPHHLWNTAELYIWNFKNQFDDVITTTDPDFPISEWYLGFHQAVIELKSLRNSQFSPIISSYAYKFGDNHFNLLPMAPPGALEVIHKNSDQCISWVHHITKACYIGPMPELYRYMRCYNNSKLT